MNENYSITFEAIYYRYIECCAALKREAFTKCKLGNLITTCFPNCTRRVLKSPKDSQTYIGLGWRSACPCDLIAPKLINAEEVLQEFTGLCQEFTADNYTKTVTLDTKLTCNGNTVLKEITFADDSWSLKVRNVTVDLEKQMISSSYYENPKVEAEIIHHTVNNIRQVL